MRNIITSLMLLLLPVVAGAVTVPAGTYHFDNSLTAYTTVKFVYGNDAENRTTIVELTKGDGNLWTFVINATAEGQTHYFFTDTTLPTGVRSEKVTTVKDYIITRGEHRTQTFKDNDNLPMIPGATFVPSTGEQYATGTWQTDSKPASPVSGTLPVLYINTENKVPITSKDDYVSATCYVNPMGVEGCPASGTEEAPLTLSIKGRGNWTWLGFDKKPYRLKLAAKEPMLGMKKSKHFVLMAGADDNLGFMRNPLGYELARRMHLAWTPDARPVEVVLNGDYIGLYFLTENVRVDADRVNVIEQDDLATEDVTGGWLVEVDNYNTDPHINVKVTDKSQDIWITYKSPEVLSQQQETYLQQQFDAIRDAVYDKDKTSTTWEKLIDIDAMARVYVVRELMHDEEGFHGSFYLHKERGNDTRWVAGPVWDFGNAYSNSNRHKFIWQNPTFECFFIDQIYQFPRFVEAVKNVFGDFYRNEYPTVNNFIDNTAATIATAAVSDKNRWPAYGTTDINGNASTLKYYLKDKVEWLAKQWGTTGTAGIGETHTPAATETVIYDMQGRRVSHTDKPGIYIIRNGSLTRKINVK